MVPAPTTAALSSTRVARMASNWLDQSIVAKRGIGWSKKPHLHDLTEALQGKYHYTIGPYSDPVLTVRPGNPFPWNGMRNGPP